MLAQGIRLSVHVYLRPEADLGALDGGIDAIFATDRFSLEFALLLIEEVDRHASIDKIFGRLKRAKPLRLQRGWKRLVVVDRCVIQL